MSFSAINAFAQDPVSIYNVIRENGVQHFVTLHHVDGEYGWGILIYSQKGEQVLSVIDEDTGKLIFKYSHMVYDGYIQSHATG